MSSALLLGRQDRVPVPKMAPDGSNWEWNPRNTIVVIKDAAPAAANALSNVWPSYDIHVGTCCTHADCRWMSNNIGKFKDGEKSKVFSADIQYKYKLLGHVNLIDEAQRMMREKWSRTLKEADGSSGSNSLFWIPNILIREKDIRGMYFAKRPGLFGSFSNNTIVG